ncbi:MAG: polyprenyl synthetase family protein [Phycisphaeraceae bacterium]|nr:polyprenyl synthetase family protein [Phycisphaeraceae bacterium]MCW5762853.1 polyprenyl synthetase family protein [Phycisphaeraceae bacterium]
MQALKDLSSDLEPLALFLASQLERVSVRFDEHLRCELPPVSELCAHVERYRGKMLRPTLVLLCGVASSAEPDGLRVSEEHITLAAVSEMVHMATLVHDDVLDEAETRRRGQTVNRLRGNEAAVILGDYLIAGAFHLCSQVSQREASLVVGQASMDMCAGELLQLHNRENFSIDERTYYEIVRRKTGALIGAACRLGAIASGARAEVCDLFEQFGMSLGTAFQIQDDLLDLTGRAAVVGKDTGKDPEKGKLTLPMIHHLLAATVDQRARTLGVLEDVARHGPGAAVELATVLESTGSIAHAKGEAERLVAEACAMLSAIEPSKARDLLEHLARAAVNRAY